MSKSVEDGLEDFIWGNVDQSSYLQKVVKCEERELDSVLKRVSQIDDTLNRQLRKEVEQNLSRLLEQTTALEALDGTQKGVHTDMNDVHERCDKFAKNLQGLAEKFREENKVFENAVKIRNIIEDAIKCEDLIDAFEKRSELVKRSEIVCEIQGIVSDNPELLQISWLRDTITSKLKAAVNEVRRAAADDLRRALISLNASLVASATKALSNLGVLNAELEVQLSSAAAEVDAKLAELAVSPEPMKLLPVCVNLIHSQLEQSTLLGNSHMSKFSEKIARSIRTRVPLDAAYALRFVQQMGRVLQSRPECSLGPLDDALRPLKASLLSQSLQRLHKMIDQHDFTSSHANAFVDVLNTTFEEELSKVQWDNDLKEDMQKTIRKSIGMVAKRFEMETKLDNDSLLFGDRLNSIQLTNYRLLQSAHSLAARWPAHSAPLNAFQSEVLGTIMQAIKKSITTILATMHTETLGARDVSPYMQELCAFLQCVILHAAHMGGSIHQANGLSSLCDFVLEQFLLYSTLIRPLNPTIRTFLHRDLLSLLTVINEMGCGSKYPEPSQLTLLYTENISELPENLPIWAIIHILICDSPAVLVSPHTSVEWTVDEYVSWCNEHNIVERLAFLNSLLSSYANSVVARGEKEYIQHYPMLVHYLKRGMT
ncbi:unnamed protein product [Auanema sp. JU1783]|nr:unnamed protein product [Auanema sp. JU1783]